MRMLRFEPLEQRMLLASAPLALADSFSVSENGTLNVLAAGVLSNDTDSDGDALSAILVAGPSHGSLTLNADGSFAYAPAADFGGIDSFTYKANDGGLDSAAATVTIDITQDPAVRTGVVSGVSNQAWTRVSLDHGYKSMVVVLSPQYAAGSTPLIARCATPSAIILKCEWIGPTAPRHLWPGLTCSTWPSRKASTRKPTTV